MKPKHIFTKCFLVGIFLYIPVLLIMSCSSVHQHQTRRSEILYKRGCRLHSAGKLNEAMLKLEESMSLAKRTGNKPAIVWNLNEMGWINFSRGNYAKARKIFTEALEISKELHMDTEISQSLNNIAGTYLGERNFKEAINRYKKLIEWDKKVNNDLGTARTLYNIGLIYQNNLQQYREAQASYSEALKIFKKLGHKKYIQLLERSLDSVEH